MRAHTITSEVIGGSVDEYSAYLKVQLHEKHRAAHMIYVGTYATDEAAQRVLFHALSAAIEYHDYVVRGHA